MRIRMNLAAVVGVSSQGLTGRSECGSDLNGQLCENHHTGIVTASQVTVVQGRLHEFKRH